ncbi:hemagglutinin repeat-containing protein [Acinetobacter sp.]|uniref:two-partner secretion domain-containing protein n=1 Tax=Acinetobacter sp. TaxID=472 RepID=UPI00333E208A
MNKNRYRVIYSQARGMFIAVAEIVKSRTKAAGQTHAEGEVEIQDFATSSITYKKLNPVNFAVVSLLGAAIYTLPMATIAESHIVADKSAPNSQQATILNTSNGLTQVNIQTPSAGGVSRNTYTQFDVGQEGAILNNARNNTQTQLGGWVQGNPWLAKGEAKVILNEVNSSHPSQLKGYLEVAGKQAQVVIANPSGLVCDGCGVINADRFTLTTGQAVMHQGYLDSFRVREGQVTIEGKGLNGSLTPYTDIYTRALNVNAGLYANELKTVLGQNDISIQDPAVPQIAKAANGTNTTSQPNFALDVGQLGGMYAGKIYLVGNENGLGVRNAGSINATTGQLSLNANGDLTNTGNMIANKDQIIVQAQDVKNSGNISSTQHQIQIQADTIQNNGLIATNDEIKLKVQGEINNNEGVINAGRVDFTAHNLSNHKGKIEQTGQQQLNIYSKTLDNSLGLIGQATKETTGTGQQPGGTTHPTVTDPEQQSTAKDSSTVGVAEPSDLTPKTFETGNIQIAQDVANVEGSIVNNADISLNVQDSIKNNGGEIQLPELQFNGQNFENQQGKLTAKVVNITAQLVDNQKGLIDANQSFDLNAVQLNNTQGRVQSAKAFNLNSTEINNNQGQILAADRLSLNSKTTNNSQGVIGSINADAELSIQTLDNRQGEISAKNVQLNGQSLNNQQGTIQAKKADLTINVDQIDNGTTQDSAGHLIAGQNLKLNALQLQSTGQIYAGNSADLTVTQLKQHGQLAALNKINLQANTITSDKNAVWAAGLDKDGKLSNTDAILNIDGQNVQIAGKILSGKQIQIKAVQSTDLSQSESQAQNINIATSELKTNNAKIIANQQLDLIATQNIDNEKGQYSAEQINLNTAQINNDQGLIQHTGKNDFILDVANQIDNNAGQIISNANNTDIKTNTLNSKAGEILHAGDQQLKITAQNLQGQQGKIQSNSHLKLELGTANLDQASTSAQQIDLNATALSHQQGQLIQSDADGQLNLNVAQTLNNTLGVISAAGDTQVNVGQLNNITGKLLVDGQLDVKVDDINNTKGTVYSDNSINMVAKQGVNNQQGIVAAKQAIYVNAQSFNNIEGTLQSEQSKLDLNISGALNNQLGKLLSNQDITIQSLSLNNASGTIFSNQGLNLDLDGEIENQLGTIAANNNISVNAQSLNNTSGQIRSEKEHLNIITQQNLKNDSGVIVAAKNVTMTAQDMSSQKGQIQAGQHANLAVKSLDNTAGTIYAEDQLKLNVLEHIHNQDGVIAANQAFNLNAGSLSNNGGKLIAQQSAMQLDIANELSNTKGEISAAQDLTIKSGHLNNTEGKTVGGQTLQIKASTLDNHLGVIYTQDQSKIIATDQVNNTFGTIVAQKVDLTSQSLLNELGKIRAEQGSLNLSVDNELSNLSGEIFAQQEVNLKAQQINNQKGKIQSISKANIETNTLDNQSGTIYTQDQLLLLAQSEIQNQKGTIAAQKNLQIKSTDLNNEQGIIQSEQGSADLSVQGALNNHQGELFASKGLNVVAQGIDNRLGQISSLENLNLDSQFQTLNNESGKILADQMLLKTGLLNNNSGLIQSNSELSIDTHQHDLFNQNSGADGGILSQGKLNLIHVQQLLNDNGLLASADDVQISTQQLSNQKGQINSQGNLTIAQQQSGGWLNNQGQIQALKNIQIHIDQLNNSGQGSHIVAGEDLSVQSQVIENQQNLNDTILGGLDAQNIQLNARELNNQLGGIRASKDASLLIQQHFNNQQGSVTSIGTLLIGDSQKTLNLNNTQGELIAQNRLAISANNLINQGKIISLGDAELNLKQSYTHQQGDELNANGLLKINSEHDFINQAALSAGQGVTVNAQNILNQTGASISSIETHLIAQDVLHNQGLINGELTHLKADSVWNDGAKIYGDHIAIQAQTLNNKNNQDRVGAVIASRGDIDLGIKILNNQAGGLINSDSKDNAWILSMGQLNVGDSLDGKYQAHGQAQLINNRSATIESQGNMRLSAKEIQNLNDNFSVHQVLESSQFVHSYEDNRKPGIDIADQIIGYQQDNGFVWLLLKDGQRFRTYNIFEYDKEIYVPEVLTSTPGQILSGGNMLLQSDHIVNDQSQILAAGVLKVEGTDIDNKAYLANKLIQFKNPKKWFYDSGKYYSMKYSPADETEPYELSGLYGGNKVIGTPTADIKEKNSDTVHMDIKGSKQAHAAEYEIQQIIKQQIEADTGQQIKVKQSENEKKQLFGEIDPEGTQQQGHSTESQKVDTATQMAGSENKLSGVEEQTDYEIRHVKQNTISLPSNALFSQTKDSQAQYLVETDPAFSQYKKWLSSDYMLDALGLDPANQQKRLGDGFYEQRLIQDQIAQLTGRRFLSGYGRDDEQYKALMNNGLTFAKSYNLRPGIALTAAQIAQLTSDIVWLEERTIKLADGTTTTALVPQVYVRARVGDLKGDGTLISADQIQLDMKGDVLNQATIAGREALIMNANNINQLAGRMEANRVGIKTQNDLNNNGGQINAKEAASFDIGGDLNLTSTLTSNHKQNGKSNYGFTEIDRKAGIYVGSGQTSTKGTPDDLKTTLNIKVGGNTTLKAAEIFNANGGTVLQTAGDVKLETLQTERVNNSYKNNKNYDFSTTQAEVGNQIASKSNLTITGKNIDITGSQISSEQGRTTLSADEQLNIQEGRARSTVEHADEVKKKSFLSSKTTQTYRKDKADEAIASTVEGQEVILDAKNIKIQGSDIVSDELTQIQAKENVSITGAENSYLNYEDKKVKKSGLMSSGGIGFSLGSKKERTEQEQTKHTNTGSSVGSLNGNTNIIAGKTYQQTGSTVSSQKGDVNILAQQVNIEAAKEQSTRDYKYEMEQKGLTLAVNVPVVSAVQSALDSSKQVGQSKNDRVNAMAAANAGFDAYKAGQALGKLQGALSDASKLNGNVEVGVSLTYGEQKNTQFSHSESTTASQSQVYAGGKTNIVATGAGEKSNINIIGSDVVGMQGTHLAADHDVNIKAAEQKTIEASGNKSAGWNAGVSVSSQTGFGVTAGGNLGKGKGNGTDTSYVNSHVGSKDSSTTISSGNATNIIGGQVQGKGVQIDANELNIESLQDKATYKSKQQNISGQVSVGTNGASINSGNASTGFSKSNVNANYASVNEQSGIFAGDDGYQINVKNNTDLKGAIITSTQTAENLKKNSLDTGTLTHSDIRNVSEYDAKGISLSAGFNAGKSDPKGGKTPDTVYSAPDKVDQHASTTTGVSKSIGFGLDSDKDSSVTKSGINTSNITIRDEQGQQALTGKTAEQIKSDILTSVTTDTARENSGALKNNFDKDKVQSEINLQMEVTKNFDANRQEAKAEINKKIDEFKAAGNIKDADQWQKAGVLLDMVSAGLSTPTASGLGIAASTLSPVASYKIGQYFKEQASNNTDGKLTNGQEAAHILAHTVLGAAVAAAGGNDALTAGLSAGGAEAAAPKLAQYLYGKDTKDLTADEKSTISAITGLVASGVGATTGDVSSTVQSGNVAQNAVEDNSLAGDDLRNKVKQGVKWTASQTGIPIAQGVINGVGSVGDGILAIADAFGDTAVSAIHCPLGTSACADAMENNRQKGEAIYQFLANLDLKEQANKIKQSYADLASGDPEKVANAQRTQAEVFTSLGLGAIGGKKLGYEGSQVGNLSNIKRILENDPAKLPLVKTSTSGNISAKQITENGKIIDPPKEVLNKQQQLLNNTDNNKSGILREEIADSYFKNSGYTKLESKCGSNCFDGVYTKNGELYIVEVKPLKERGSVKLSDNKKSTNDIGVQMSDKWIVSRTEALVKTKNPDAIKTATLITKAVNEGKPINKIVVGVNDSRAITLNLGNKVTK